MITWGMSVPASCRTPPGIQLCDRSCWSHIPAGTPHLGSFPSPSCTPASEGLAVTHTEPWTCASCHLVDGERNLIGVGKCCQKCPNAAERSATVQFKASPWLKLYISWFIRNPMGFNQTGFSYLFVAVINWFLLLIFHLYCAEKRQQQTQQRS